ncbi:MAG: hypothetical protein GY862_05885 [Gammaproteobacteria bacterium]|nr:hypothetical protein [Gammaproteobacteria bacterium]
MKMFKKTVTCFLVLLLLAVLPARIWGTALFPSAVVDSARLPVPAFEKNRWIFYPVYSVSDSSAAPSSVQAQPSDAKEKRLPVFFIVGFVINILLITAFIAWAVKEWRKTGTRESKSRHQAASSDCRDEP